MAPQARSRLRRLLMGLAVAFGVLLALELGFRLVLVFDSSLSERIDRHRELAAPQLDRGFRIEPHPYWAYNTSTLLPGVNRYGFTTDDLPFEKQPGTLRVVCLGASTTAGPTNWPYFLQEVLTEKGVEAEVINLATEGWTTAESLVTLSLLGQDYEPDVVVVHHAHNDLAPMMMDGFRPDYAHHRKTMSVSRNEMGVLNVKQDLSWAVDWTLVRSSSLYVYLRLWVAGDRPTVYTLAHLTTYDGEVMGNPQDHVDTFKRNLRTIGVVAESVDARVVLTTMPYLDGGAPGWAQRMDDQNKAVVDVATREGWILAPLHEQAWEADWFVDDLHLDDAGNRVKAERIAEALLAR